MTKFDRRTFLKRGGIVTGGVLVAGNGLQALTAAARAEAGGEGRRRGGDGGYGPLAPVADQNGEEILALPAGFSYVTFSKIGETMSDGTLVPLNHDGMAAFSGPRGTVRLIRNHEVRTPPGTIPGSVMGPTATKYDALGVGGTTTLDFDTRRMELVRDFVSLNGTIVNCAGGIALGGTGGQGEEDADEGSGGGTRPVGWLTSEETVAGPRQGWGQKHGYNFLVPAAADEATPAVALRAMGRFAHEAVAADPRTGFVYETEDSGNDSGFFRFRPADRRNLEAGGVLEMLGVVGRPGYDAITGQTVGESLRVTWIRIDDPDPDLEAGATPVALQGIAGGAAMFNRLEGIWYDPHTTSFFFNSTSGGDAGYGQVWQYDPRRETLSLFFESPGGSVLDSPDNLLVTPRGGILLCEDDASDDLDTHPLAPGITNVNRLIGLTPRGEAFEFAVNRLNSSELAGACFSPDGRTLFVNLFGNGTPGSGMTCAIAGPWSRGAL